MSTWTNNIKHGRAIRISDIADYTFNDAPFLEDSEAIKDKTFEELQDLIYTNETKNVASFTNSTKNSATLTNETKN